MTSTPHTAIQLGDSVNLVTGFTTSWHPTSPTGIPYFLASQQALTRVPPLYTPTAKPKRPFVLTRHESAESLLSAVYPYIVTISPNSHEPVVGAGALLLSEPNRPTLVAEAQQLLGVDLTNPDLRYVLVQNERIVGTSSLSLPAQPSLEWFYESSELPEGTATEQSANTILAFTNRWGSHFVSAVDFGDILFQVFAYSSEMYNTVIVPLWKTGGILDSPNDFQGYTSLKSKELPEGAAAQQGHLLSIAKEEAFVNSVAAGEWKDTIIAKADSIFTINNFNGKEALAVYRKLNASVPIQIYFSSVSQLLHLKKEPLFVNILTSALLTKVGAPFVVNTLAVPGLPSAYSDTFSPPSRLTPVTSLIMTPQVSLFQEILDAYEYLANVRAAEKSESVILLANVLKVTNKITIPAKQCVLIAGLLFGGGTPTTKTNVAEIVVSDSAFDDGHFYFLDSVGYVEISTPTRRRKLLTSNNVTFTLRADSGRYVVETSKHATVLPPTLLSAKVPATSFNTSADRLSVLFDTSFSTVSLNLLKTTAVPQVLLDYLAFVGGLIPSNTANKELITSRTRALSLRGSIQPTDRQVQLVPYETYEQYKDLVGNLRNYAQFVHGNLQTAQTQIEIRKVKEAVFDVGTQLNENIRETGQLIVGLIDATAQNQGNLSNYYNSLASKTKQALAATNTNVLRLDTLIKESRDELNKLTQQIKIEWNNWIVDQKVKLAFQVVGAIFSLGFSVAEMVLEEDPTKIFEILEKFQQLMEVVSELSKTINESGGPADALGEGTALLNGSLSDMPTDDEFQRLQVFLKTVFVDAPAELPSLPKWAPAVDILMINGVAWTHAITEREALRLELYKNQEMIKISDAYQKDLQSQKDKYNVSDLEQLDVDNVDLIGATDYLQFILSRTCQQLANTLATQSTAVQYQYLAEPIAITKFDLGSLLQLGGDIEQSIHDAIPLLQPEPAPLAPVTLEFPILESQLQPGAVKNIDIPISQPEFFNYVMVRVEEVSFRAHGVHSTASGNYELQVTFTGDSFADRDIHREVKVFKTTPRIYSYIYDVKTGKLIQGGPGPISDRLTRVTPFETWSVTFPHNVNNKGIKFDADAAVEIEFKTNVIAKTPPNMNPALAMRSMIAPLPRSALKGAAPFAARLAAAPPPPALKPASDSAGAPSVTKDDVLTQLSRASVMKGWDCVLSMDLNKVNKILELQYKTPEFQNIPREVVQSVEVTEADQDDPDIDNTYKISAEFYVGPAKAQFLAENGKLRLEIEIFETDPKGTGKKSKHVRQKVAPEEGKAKEYPVVAGTKFITIVPIEAVTGDVANKIDVVLNFQFATDSQYTFERDGKPTQDKILAKAVTAMFYQKGYKYLFVQINTIPNNAIPELVPSFFRFSMYNAHTRPVLNTYINTTTKPIPQKPEFGISYPLPDALDIDCCMFINNRISFRQILYSGFKKSKNWEVKINQASGETDFDSLSCSTQVFLEVPFPKVSGISVPSNQISLPMGDYGDEARPGLTITPKFSQFDMVCDYKASFDQAYSFNDESQGTTNVTVNFKNVKITIDVASLSSSEVKLSYNLQSTDMTVDSHIQIDKDCCGKESNNEASAQLSDNLKKYFPAGMTQALNEVEFESVSVMVLQSLLFPASYMRLNAANNPGDIVLWGQLNDK